jgi:ferredoxin, 2Fe-2S
MIASDEPIGMIYVVDREGVEHSLKIEHGSNIMETIRDAGLPVEAICGGQCICTTCHVYIDEIWKDKLGLMQDMEQALVEDSGSYQDNSRLSCQIDYHDVLNGLRVTLAPEF